MRAALAFAACLVLAGPAAAESQAAFAHTLYLVVKALHVDLRSWPAMSVAHASLTIIRVQPDGSMNVLAVGDSGHIPSPLLSWGDAGDRQLVAPASR